MELTPDPDEIVQAEEMPAGGDHIAPIGVTVLGPVQTREAPAIRGSYRTEVAVGTAVAVRLLTFEPRRKEAYLWPLSQDIYISGSQAGAQTGAAAGMRIPAMVPWRIGHLDEVWACAVTATTDISVQSDYWSE